ncbi:MAG TPA: GNAT family N-acetyltransferase [Chloroflexia bacterium]|nr:GNAT family N-acetyltransferase [Chloroflexia bacterium]
MSLEPVSIVAPGKRKHAEQIFELVATQWRDDLKRHAREGRINRSHYDWKTSRVGIANGRVVAHFGVYNLTMRVGTARVATAGVNLVVTDPDFRQRGLMPSTIRASLDAMRKNGYELSLVCNAIANYYTRFGYVSAWPEHDVTVRARDLPHDGPDFRLHRFAPRHRPELSQLYNTENATLTGTVVRPTFLRTKEPGDLYGYTWGVGEAVRGYLMYDVVSNGRAVWHYDSAGDAGERLRVMGQIERRAGCEEVRFISLHPNSGMARAIRTLNSTADETYRPTGGWLVRVINLRTLFEKLAGELSRRLACSHLAGWRGNLLIASQHEQVLLSIDRSRVEMLPPEDAEHEIRGGEAIARLVIGSAEPDELVKAHNMQLSGDGMALATVLFPAQRPQMGNADL